MQNRLLFLITVIIGLFVKGQSIDFKWEKDSINGKLVDKIAMSVPFTIENKRIGFNLI